MKTPDIEIYVKHADMEILSQWLSKNFAKVEMPSHATQVFAKGKAIKSKVYNDDACSDLLITPKASGKDFCSIWIKNNISHWENDESCARSLLEEADFEIRCSVSGWQEEEEEDQNPQWLLLTRTEQKLISW